MNIDGNVANLDVVTVLKHEQVQSLFQGHIVCLPWMVLH